MPRRKKPDQDRVFDVSKPNKVSPSATSRPVIASHGPVAPDPMMKENDKPELLRHDKTVTPIPVGSGDNPKDDKPPAEPASPKSDEPEVAVETKAGPLRSPELDTKAPEDDKPADKASDEPDFGSNGPLFTEPTAPSEAPVTTASNEAENSEPLSPVLASPQADDPVGLSNSSISLPEEPKKMADTSDTNPEESSTDSGKSKDGKKPDPEISPPPPPPADLVVETLPFATSHGAGPFTEKTAKRWLLPGLILALICTYLLIDAGVFGSGIKLPFEIFKDSAETSQQPTNETPNTLTPIDPNTKTPTSNIPVGFSSFPVINTNIIFAYPTVWGAASTSIEPGFAQRGSTSKPTGDYAYLVNFSINKDVQVAITSSKFLPAKRTPTYYDYLQWCTGSNDSKFYKQVLMFTTEDGVDSPSTAVCNQGPLLNTSKINNSTLVELKSTGADDQLIGDIYTRNLDDDELSVLRIKDASMKNGATIRQLLDTLKFGVDKPAGS